MSGIRTDLCGVPLDAAVQWRVSPQKSFQGSQWSLPCILEERGSGRWKTKRAKCISQSWQQYSANTRTAMMESQIALPVQPGFRNFGVMVSLAKKGSWPLSWLLWPCSLVFGIFRCFKQRSCNGCRYQSFPGNIPIQVQLCSL